ncbi:type II toxin-antitoxin system VapB family antitoxin [Vreelandella sulfidaeris]|uniref:type II toxin-antitoxin system VapB family antitoxin n=1 Tax=Vreelandella sulfidaeris TaxID=115553 RepID=UPI0035E83A63|tara:strand:+ start:1220 stop:1450 length:231 start_codon:yes stop_codon:yes gene_type:complete
MEKAAVFKSNRSQAVRMPKSLALPENITRVDVIALGRARLITPVGEAWDSWFDGQSVTADFMSEREQPNEQEREAF